MAALRWFPHEELYASLTLIFLFLKLHDFHRAKLQPDLLFISLHGIYWLARLLSFKRPDPLRRLVCLRGVCLSLCVSATLMLNMSETKRFEEKCPWRVDW